MEEPWDIAMVNVVEPKMVSIGKDAQLGEWEFEEWTKCEVGMNAHIDTDYLVGGVRVDVGSSFST